MATIPTLDLSTFVNGNADQRAQFVRDIGRAFQEIGFVAVVHHGISKDLISSFYSASQTFFALPVGTKRQYEINGLAGQRGYTSFGTEHAKHSTVADLKEFFQIGQDVPADHPLRSVYPDNVQVAEVPALATLGNELYRAFEEAGGHLLRAIALHLGLDGSYFDAYITNGNSILRSIYYPPITQEPETAIRSEQHEDINLITLLVGASAGGLELLTSDETWMPVQPEADEIVINVGDMLQRLTNNVLKSTTHRVVNPPREEWHQPRLSIPFFLHPVSNMSLDCLPSCVSEERPPAYPPITAGAYLDERLREIGLKS